MSDILRTDKRDRSIRQYLRKYCNEHYRINVVRLYDRLICNIFNCKHCPLYSKQCNIEYMSDLLEFSQKTLDPTLIMLYNVYSKVFRNKKTKI